jgi:ABC-type uncharacterized transport system auxiliary subunit
MMRIPKAILLFTGILFLTGCLLTGCMSQKQPTSKYYVIERPDSLKGSITQQQPVIDGYCEVAPVDVYPAFASQSIARRKESHEIVYYSYHHWAVRPGESMTMLLEDYMSQAAIFNGVSMRFWKISPAYKLETKVYRLEALPEKKEMFAHLSLRFTLLNARDNEKLVVHHADRKEQLSRKDLNLYAKTVGELFHEELHRFSEKIRDQLGD